MRISRGKWYTASEAAPLLEVTGPTVKEYLKNGTLRGRQIGFRKQWHVKGSEIQRLRRKLGLDIIRVPRKP